MKTLFFIFALASFSAFADECADLYAEAVTVEKDCMNYQNYLNAEIQKGEKIYAALDNLSYKNQREIDTMNSLRKSIDNLSVQGQKELNKRCNKRWDVSAIYLNICPTGAVKCGKKANSTEFDLRIHAVTPSTKSHVLHTYPTQYECLIRKKKIETASKAL